MATKEFPLVPRQVPEVNTRFRTIQTAIPVPQSVETLRRLRLIEPRSMGGQPPVIWDHGDNFVVCDPYGNRWLDFSSGVLVTSSGHGRREIVKAIQDHAGQGLYHAYCFPTEIRLKLVEEITGMLPAPLRRVFLLTTGSEATECCIKLARTYGLKIGGKKKNILVTFDNGFHGRTMGAQLAGGAPALKQWIGEEPSFVQVPYPDGFRQKDTSFDGFVKALADRNVDADSVCGVMSETYQGCNAVLIPADYAQALRVWCDRHKALLILDEIQAGFGRTGRLFGFMHLNVVPDLVACGKAISGGMPLSAVLGTEEVMDLYGPGEMTSTHSANPISCAAALANQELIRREGLVENAAALAPCLAEGTARIAKSAGGRIGHWASTGLVSAVQFTKPGSDEPDPEPAWEMVRRAVERGVLLFAPVGVGGCAVKINPPLTVTEEALQEGLSELEQIAAEL
jgi:4-aminobutyrate aminotransferase-like enzyme